MMLLAMGALLTLIIGAVTRDQAAGTAIAITTAIGAGLWALQTPPELLAPTLGLSASGLARLFTAGFSFMAAGVLVLSSSYNRHRGISGEEYPSTVLFTTFGMVALASSTNLLTLFLGLEAMTFGFYILVAIDLNRETSGEAGLKYLLMGALSAAFLAFGIALIYCLAGTLDIMDAVQFSLTDETPNPIAMAGWGCLLIGIAFKLSLVPAHLWTPDVYEAAPSPVAAFLSGGSKGASVLLLLLLLPQAVDLDLLRLPLLALSLLSMLLGNLAALRQNSVRRMLAYSSIAQMGYVVVALISSQGDGFQAAAFYAIAYAIMSLAAFGAISVLERGGCGAMLDSYNGRGFTHPVAGAVLALALFSLAGIPPTIGFTGKFLIFASAIRSGEIWLSIFGILTAAVSVYFYLRVVTALYLQRCKDHKRESISIYETIVLGLSSVLIIALGLFPSQLLIFLKLQLPWP